MYPIFGNEQGYRQYEHNSFSQIFQMFQCLSCDSSNTDYRRCLKTPQVHTLWMLNRLARYMNDLWKVKCSYVVLELVLSVVLSVVLSLELSVVLSVVPNDHLNSYGKRVLPEWKWEFDRQFFEATIRYFIHRSGLFCVRRRSTNKKHLSVDI